MDKIIIAAILILIRPAFASESYPVSLPEANIAAQDDSHFEAYAMVAITAALIAGAILYVTKDRSGLVEDQRVRPWRLFIDHEAHVGITIDF